MNDYNYVRVSRLEPVSIESLALVVVLSCFCYLVYKKRANWDIAYFFALPFTDSAFRVASLEPVEFLGMALVALHWRRIRLNYVILIGAAFFLFSVLGYVLGNVHSLYSPLYSLRFVLIGLVFSVFRSQPFRLPVSAMRFLVLLSFAMTFLQAALWLAGLPIHGVFYNGILPRTKGLAQEPATWSIWVVTLFPFILHFKLGRLYLALNFVMLLLTFSTFGTISAVTFFGLRWLFSGAHFRLRKSVLRSAAVAVVLLSALLVVKPETGASVTKLFSVFNKLILYQQELTQISQGQQADANAEDVSGRGNDFSYFRETFPEHWLVGIGSFNAPYDVNGPHPIAGTNTYVMLPVEVGTVGVLLVALLLALHYRGLLHNRQGRSRDFLAYSVNFLLMISGIRCFAFYEPWFAQAALLRTALPAEAPADETVNSAGLFPKPALNDV